MCYEIHCRSSTALSALQNIWGSENKKRNLQLSFFLEADFEIGLVAAFFHQIESLMSSRALPVYE